MKVPARPNGGSQDDAAQGQWGCWSVFFLTYGEVYCLFQASWNVACLYAFFGSVSPISLPDACLLWAWLFCTRTFSNTSRTSRVKKTKIVQGPIQRFGSRQMSGRIGGKEKSRRIALGDLERPGYIRGETRIAL